MGRSSQVLSLFILISFAVSCSKPSDTAEPVIQPDSEPVPAQSIIETFEVGENTYVRALALDEKAHSLWVGTSLGVHEIDLANQLVLNTFTRDHGLANEYVFAVNVDPDGRKWFGTNAGGMSSYKDGEWKTYFPMHGLADYWIYSFANHPDGGLWIGTWAGANYLNKETGEFDTYVDELVNEWVYGLAIDSKQNVWFGTEGGVSMFDGESWTAWTHADGLGAANTDQLPFSKNTGLGTRARHDLGVMSGGNPTYNPNYVFSILVAADDSIWAGTWGGGVSRFMNNEWHNLSSKDGLAGDIVYSIAQDSEGIMWFGTNRGISRYDGTRWTNYNVHTGLPNNNVYALVTEANGDIWAGVKGGVVHLGYQKN